MRRASGMMMGLICCGLADVLAGVDPVGVPGTVICHSPVRSGRYIGSPSLARLANGELIASHDFFGPASGEHTAGITRVYASDDGGTSWHRRSEVSPASHSRVFTHGGALYMLAGRCYRRGRFRYLPRWGRRALFGMGFEDNPPNRVLLRRSRDGGRTWSEPVDSSHGVLRTGGGTGGPTPPVCHDGRLYIAAGGLFSAPVSAELLDAANWSFRPKPRFDPAWLGGQAEGYFEGGAVITPEGIPAILTKVRYFVPGEDRAALIAFPPGAMRGRLNPDEDFVPMPGARLKFSVRHDPRSDLYWSLTSFLPREDYGPRTDLRRNTVALVCSPDLRRWSVRCILLHHPDTRKHGFQYLDFLFDGADLVAVCRTAWPDGEGGPKRQHDANYLTFHRWKDFRELGLADSAAPAKHRLGRTLDALARNAAD